MKSFEALFYYRVRVSRLMRPRELAVTGGLFVLAMNVVFFATGTDRGPIYEALQVLGIVACVPIVAGARRDRPVMLAVGFGLLGLDRLLHVVLDQSRLPGYIQWPMLLAFAGMAYGAAARAAGTLRAACWLAALLHFAATVFALSGGRVAGMLGLLAGTLGLSLLAPNLGLGEGQAQPLSPTPDTSRSPP